MLLKTCFQRRTVAAGENSDVPTPSPDCGKKLKMALSRVSFFKHVFFKVAQSVVSLCVCVCVGGWRVMHDESSLGSVMLACAPFL